MGNAINPDQEKAAGVVPTPEAAIQKADRIIIVGNLGRVNDQAPVQAMRSATPPAPFEPQDCRPVVRAGGFDRRALPDPVGYYEAEGLKLTGRGKWRTTECKFHGGSDSMRINTESGAFVCMAGCGARGGDVLSYHMAQHGLEFVEAAKALGAWVDDGRPAQRHRPTPLTPRQALEVLAYEANLTAHEAARMANGAFLTPEERRRLLTAAGRIAKLVEVFA